MPLQFSEMQFPLRFQQRFKTIAVFISLGILKDEFQSRHKLCVIPDEKLRVSVVFRKMKRFMFVPQQLACTLLNLHGYMDLKLFGMMNYSH